MREQASHSFNGCCDGIIVIVVSGGGSGNYDNKSYQYIIV